MPTNTFHILCVILKNSSALEILSIINYYNENKMLNLQLGFNCMTLGQKDGLYLQQACTVEPLNKGHIGTSHCVLCREVVLSLEVENELVLWESEYKSVLYREVISIVSFIWRVHYQRLHCTIISHTHRQIHL